MNELVNGTLSEAIEKLAAWAADRRTRPAAYREKRAAPDFLASLGEAVQNNPALSHALVGGGLGAAAGGIGTAFKNRKKDPSERKSIVGSALTGGLAGAGVGAGVGAARMGLDGLNGKGEGLGVGGGHPGPGEFTDPATGQKMRIDPQALKDDPDLHRKVKSLTSPNAQTLFAGGLGGMYEAAKERMPTSMSVLPWVAGADLALHAPGVGLAHTTPEEAGGYWGRKFLAKGVAESKLMPSHVKELLINDNAAPGKYGDTTIATPGTTSPAKAGTRLGRLGQNLWGSVTGNKPGEGVLDILGRTARPGTGVDPALTIETPKTQPVDKFTNDETTGRPISKRVEHEPVVDAHGKPVNEKLTFNRGGIGTLKGEGSSKIEHFKDRNMFRLPGTNRLYRGAASPAGAAALRLGAYGLPMLAEYTGRGIQQDMQDKESLRDLMARYAKPVPEGK